MFKKLKLKLAALKLQIATKKAEKEARRAKARAKKSTKTDSKNKSAVGRVLSYIIRIPSKTWNWISTRNTIGLINLALLAGIIVLFSILIIDLYDANQIKNGKNGSALFRGASADETSMTTEQRRVIVRTSVSVGKQRTINTVSLPLEKPATVSTYVYEKVVVPTRNLSGDIIIDGEDIASLRLMPGDNISGNLIVQNVRRFKLPHDIKINGNLILRNAGIVKFCGPFTITGNIYVSRNSSFGPIPREAHLGGQVLF